MIESELEQKMRWLDRLDGGLFKLLPTFLENYLKSKDHFSESIFVTCYGYRGETKSATFADFHRDVCLVASQFEIAVDRTKIAVLVGGNSYAHLVYIVAHILSGVTISPMNPADGVERILKKIETLESNVKIWIDPSLDGLSSLNGDSMAIPQLGQPTTAFSPCAYGHDQPMILIFTSGSTGYSKVAQQLESNVISNVDATIEHFDLKPGKVVLTPLPVFHVNALEFAFFGALFSGAKLVLIEGPLPTLIGEAARLENANIISAVPQILRALVEQFEPQHQQVELPQLQYFVTAAAPLNYQLIERLQSKFGRQVLQGYGLSEAVNFTCLLPTELDEVSYRKWMKGFSSPSIGIPVRGNEISILDEAGMVLDAGEIGEVAIRGRNVMKGYCGDQTQQVFEGGFLRTGDIGLFHRDEQGRPFYFITGRIKEVAKRYGVTLSLREIDDVAAKFELAGFDAIAIAFANEWVGEDVGLAMKVPSGWSGEHLLALQSHFERNLPPHLRPKVVVEVESQIRTSSGKPCRWPLAFLFQKFYASSFGADLVTMTFKEKDLIDS